MHSVAHTFICMYMYVRIYTRTQRSQSAIAHVYTHTYKCIPPNIHVCNMTHSFICVTSVRTYIHIYVYLYVCVCVCVYVQAYVCVYLYVCMYASVCMCVRFLRVCEQGADGKPANRAKTLMLLLI